MNIYAHYQGPEIVILPTPSSKGRRAPRDGSSQLHGVFPKSSMASARGTYTYTTSRKQFSTLWGKDPIQFA